MVEVAISPGTRIEKVAPGEKDLRNARTITAADVVVGDRVLVRGSGSAQSVIVMSRADLAEKQEKERAEWIRRGVAGIVVSIDPAANQIVIRAPAGFGQTRFITVAVESGTGFRRYPPDSVRFADARPGTLAELHHGDQLRALGEKSEDGSRLKAEQVVSGSFQTVAGPVATVDSANGLVQIKELGSGRLLTIRLTPDSVLRRAPQFPMGAVRADGESQAQARPAGTGSEPRIPHAGPDFQQILARMPSISASDIKPGETIIASATRGNEGDRITAVTLVAGADALLARSKAASRGEQSGNSRSDPAAGGWNLGDMSMIPAP